jgi:CheY-like chemotaxis protein
VAEKENTDIALELAHQANASKTVFFAAANHDLRQPLHAISLLVESLRLDLNGSREVHDVFAQLEDNVRILNQMFNHFLDVSRIETGQLRVNLQTFEVQDVFNDMMAQYRLQAAEKGLQLRMSPTTAKVHSDKAIVSQILGNLISNAIAYTDQGVVWMGYRHSRQAIEVRDSGVGIAPEHHEVIFKDFYQVSNGLKNRPHSYGIGLSVVRRLAQVLHAPLSLRSQLDRGSLFRIQLQPIECAQLSPSRVDQVVLQKNNALEQKYKLLKDKRVLLIEWDEQVRWDIVNALHRKGVDVRTALSSADALGFMHGKSYFNQSSALNEWQPDLIISDDRMGRQTWFELVLSISPWQHPKKVSAHPLTLLCHCPMIFLVTELAFTEKNMGVHNRSITLSKPIDEDELLKTMIELLTLKWINNRPSH